MRTKIAYCIPSLHWPGGMERVITLKANYFAEIFHYDIYIIMTDGKDKVPYFPLSSKVNIINLDINFDHFHGKSLLIRLIMYLWKQITYKRRLTNCLLELQPDITISTLRREINFITSIKDGSIKIGEIHVNRANYRDLNQEKLPSLLKKIGGKLWMDQLILNINRLDKFVVLTHEDRQLWKEVDQDMIVTIYNPLSFIPTRTSNCQNKSVIAVGRYTYQKGFDLLIKAWEIVNKTYPDWQLHVYGGGDRRSYQDQINEFGLQDNCFLHAASPRIEDCYVESSIFAFSSRYEGFGMVLVEAMSCGLPPVSFDCPCGPKDIILDGEVGYLVECGDVSSFAERIIYLIAHDELRREMGNKAQMHAKQFNMGIIAQQWKNLFENSLENNL